MLKTKTSFNISPKLIAISFSVLVVLFSISFYIFADWTEPTADPPDGNVDAPINVGDETQSKGGSLTLNTSDGFSNALTISNGNLDFNHGESIEMRFQNSSGAPNACTGQFLGQVYYDTSIDEICVCMIAGGASDWSCGQEFIEPPSTVVDRRVFLSSTSHYGDRLIDPNDSSVTGIKGANAICQELAENANRQPDSIWRAWISDSYINAKDNIDCVNWKAYSDLYGNSIADSCSDLLDGSINSPIKFDENGNDYYGHTWTGTDTDGTVSSGYHCDNWSKPFVGGQSGNSHFTSSLWTESTNYTCSNNYPIFCFETGSKEKKVFVTSQTYQGNIGGLGDANDICDALGDANIREADWMAWLSTNTINAKDNIEAPDIYGLGIKEYYDTNPGRNLIANSPSDLTDGSLNNPIMYDESGNTISGNEVWTDTKENGTREGGPSAGNCQNWTSNSAAAQGNFGISSSSSGTWTNSTSGACNEYRHLYCFEK